MQPTSGNCVSNYRWAMGEKLQESNLWNVGYALFTKDFLSKSRSNVGHTSKARQLSSVSSDSLNRRFSLITTFCLATRIVDYIFRHEKTFLFISESSLDNLIFFRIPYGTNVPMILSNLINGQKLRPTTYKTSKKRKEEHQCEKDILFVWLKSQVKKSFIFCLEIQRLSKGLAVCLKQQKFERLTYPKRDQNYS